MATKKFKASEGKIGRNATYTIDEKGIMTLKVDLNIRLGPSASGKTTIIATSEGNHTIDGGEGAVIGLNVYTKEKK
jgi:ABC-type multidrug transport system ATPase subunit